MKKLLSILALALTALTMHAQVPSFAYLTGSSDPPVLTCSSTINNGKVYVSTVPSFYQCSNVTGSYAWNKIGSSSSGTVSSGTTGQVAVYPSNGTTVQGATALPNGITATTQTALDNSTKVATTAYVDTATITAGNTIKASGSPFTVPATSGFYWNNTASAYSFDLPAPIVGTQLCFGNYQARAPAVSIIPSTGVTIYFEGAAGTVSSATGLVSAGAAGDFICLVATDSTIYTAIGAGFGTWTNH